jgi:hypothetical protein
MTDFFEQLRGMTEQPSDEYIAAVAKFNAAVERFEEHGRELVVYWAPMLCSCRKRYMSPDDDENDGAPQIHCIVHGQIHTTTDDKIIIGSFYNYTERPQ